MVGIDKKSLIAGAVGAIIGILLTTAVNYFVAEAEVNIPDYMVRSEIYYAAQDVRHDLLVAMGFMEYGEIEAIAQDLQTFINRFKTTKEERMLLDIAERLERAAYFQNEEEVIEISFDLDRFLQKHERAKSNYRQVN